MIEFMSEEFQRIVRDNRGVSRLVQDGTLSMTDAGLLMSLILLADQATGIVITNAPELAHQHRASLSMMKKHLSRLQRKGLIRNLGRRRSRSPYQIQIRSDRWKHLKFPAE